MAKTVGNTAELQHMLNTIQQLVQLDHAGQNAMAEAEQQAQENLASIEAEIALLHDKAKSKLERCLVQHKLALQAESAAEIARTTERFEIAHAALQEHYELHHQLWIEHIVARTLQLQETDCSAPDDVSKQAKP
jgi:hypothetical protein